MLLILKKVNKGKNKHSEHPHVHTSPGAGQKHLSSRGIFNSLQGGAYFLIRIYQVLISPQDGSNCRFRPTCSAYGRKAIRTHGSFFGTLLAADRLLRCNPFGESGDDPVPVKISGN